MIRKLTLFAFCCCFLGQSTFLNAQAGDSTIIFSVIKLEPCRYRLFVNNTSPDCFNAATLLLQAGYYTGFTANSADGWVVEQLSPTELLLTHANGLFPVGATRAVDFTFFEPGGTDPILSVLYPNLCLMQSFGVDLPMEACPGGCVSGTVYRECQVLPYTNQIPLEGWTVQLVDAQNNVVGSTISDNSGAYSICDLAPGQYTVKAEALTGWKASLPPAGQWTVNVAAAANYTRDFGYCPPCSCDSIDMYISQEGSGSDTSTYYLTLSVLDSFCFQQFEIAIDTGQIIDYATELPGWIIERIGNTLVLTAPTFLGTYHYPVCNFRLAGTGNHVITVSTTYDNGMSQVECKRSFTFPNPPVEIPSSCCPSGTEPGPELVVNGDFNVTQPPPAPGSGYTTDYGWTANGTGAGHFSVLNGVQTGNANGSYWTCIGKSGNPNTDYFMVVDGATAANKVVWRESVTVKPDSQYCFSVWVNNIIRPIYDFSDPILQIQIVDPATGIVAMSSPLTLTESPNKWVNIQLYWTAPSNPNNPYRLEIRTLSTNSSGNDFALDCISFRACLPVYTCCLDEDAFCQNVENNISVTLDHVNCKATLNIGNLPDCDTVQWVNFGVPGSQSGPYGAGDMPMWNYTSNGPHIISYLVVEKDPVTGMICFEKVLHDTITLMCACICNPNSLVNVTYDGQSTDLPCGQGPFSPVLHCPEGPVTITSSFGCINPDGTPCSSAINWTLNGPDGPVAQGAIPSSFQLVLNLPPALFNQLGSYSLFMSTLCPGQTDSCYCISRWINDCCDTCENNLVLNPGFFQGASAGNLGGPGASNNWSPASGSPQVGTNFGACDPVSMQMWGNRDVGEAICQPVNFIAGHTYSIEFFAHYFQENPNLFTPYVLFELKASNGCIDPFTCTIPACESMGISPQISNTAWTKFTLPNWTASSNYSSLLIRAFNNTPDNPVDPFTISWGRIDNICIRDVTPACTADFNFTGDPCTGKFNFNSSVTGTAPITYAWNFGDPGSGANNTSTLQNPMHQFSGGGTYTVTLTANTTGCTASATATVTVHPTPVANAGPDQNICQWQITTLNATGGVSYLWNPGNSTANPFTTPSVQSTTNYTVVVTDANGCTATDQVTIQVKVCDCDMNTIVQNGSFTNSNPCILGDQDIQNAQFWNGVWPAGGGRSTGDLYDVQNCPNATLLTPPVQGPYAGIWCKPHSEVVWREGIMNQLSGPIKKNSGAYMVSMKFTCVYIQAGTARVAVYGVGNGASSTIPTPFALAGSSPPNTQLFQNPSGGQLLGIYYLDASNCNRDFNYTQFSFNFNSNILTNDIDRIFITRDDGIGGTTFANIDDVCIKPILDTTSCQCGVLKKATIQQKWTPAQKLVCDGPFITVPCRNPGADYLIQGDFTCNPHGCGNDAVTWVLSRPAPLSNITGSSSAAAYPHFQISLLAAYFTVAGNYSLTLSRQCGAQTCSCKLNFKIDPCPCLCDSTFNQEVGLGYSVSSVYLPPNQCRKRFRPIALCPTDMVTWIVPGIGTYNTVGNAPQTVTFPNSGKYKICMLVKRTDQNGNLCTREFCRDVEVKCGIGPTDPVTSFCTDVKVKNGGFNQGVVSGYLTETGLLDDWEIAANPGEGRVFVEDTAVGGSLDEGYVVLQGGKDNFAGIMQAVNLVPDSFTIINFEVNNLFGENQPAGTTLEVRLQDYPYTHDNLKKQVLLSQMIGDSGGWHRVEHSVSIAIDSSLHYLVICLQSADSARASIVGLDNFEFCSSKVSDISGLEKMKKVVRIFPNPNFGSFTVELPQAAGAGTQFRVIDLAGRLVSEQSAQTGTARQTVDAGGVPAGLYFLQVVAAGKILAIEKFVKQ